MILPVKFEEVRLINFLLQCEVEEKNQILTELSIRDELTQLYNRRYFNQVVVREIHRALRTQNSFSFLMLDVDKFKQYNDTYGHQDGDQVLMRIGKVLRMEARRASDYAFRLDGEEFALIFSEFSPEEAQTFSQSLLEKVEQLQIEHKNNSAASVVTVSMRLITRIPDAEMDLQWFYRNADTALYRAKTRRRNQLSIG